MKRYERISIPSYKPLYEASFKSGSNYKVMTLLSKLLAKRTGIEFDLDIPHGYENNLGQFRSYLGFMGNKQYRINFLLGGSDSIYSVDKLVNFKPVDTIIFEEEADNIVAVVETITDFIKGALKEEVIEYSIPFMEKKDRGKLSKTDKIVFDWVKANKEENENIITTSKQQNDIYVYYIRSISPTEKPLTRTQLISGLRKYVKWNALKTKAFRERIYKRIKPNKTETIINLPEEKPKLQAMSVSVKQMGDWQLAFDNLQKQFDILMADRTMSPYGQIVWGNGGTGKSYYYNQQKSKYNMHIEKGAPNTKHLVKLLYDYKDADCIVFDDADAVVTNKNSANILKGALDDTVGEMYNGTRYINVPATTGELKGITKETYIDSEGDEQTGFPFNANIVIITNLDKVVDQALWTRLFKAPIFMDKWDLVNKMLATMKPEEYGCSSEQGKEVAQYLIDLISTDELKIKNAQISYRVFKHGLTFVKHEPDQWKELLGVEFGIGVKTELPADSWNN